MNNITKRHFLITIDVEDWFQVENFKYWIPYSTWPDQEFRVEKNTHCLLDLFDSIPLANSGNQENLRSLPKATFFILGWVAERLPHLVREIHNRGHEVASHGFFHKLCSKESRQQLKKDLLDSKALLEDIIGSPIYGYRAPSFSINDDVLNIIEECGYHYDSSFNSFSMHSRYGHVDLSGKIKSGIAVKLSKNFCELPISNVKFGRHILPWGGGGYFRLLPLAVFKRGVQSILNKELAYMFYLHPWEIDPNQPRVDDASALFKFRHYSNLQKTLVKLTKIIESFKQCHFVSAHQYLCEIDSSACNTQVLDSR